MAEADQAHDLAGCPYARVEQVREGDILVADGGFTCLSEGSERLVLFDDAAGGLYIPCGDGKHFLDGQIEGEVYIGLYPAPETGEPDVTAQSQADAFFDTLEGDASPLRFGGTGAC